MKKAIVIILALFFVLTSFLGMHGGPISAKDEIVRKAESVIRERVDRYNRRFGVVLGIIDAQGSRVIAHGRARGETDMQEDSILDLCSVAKLFTTTLLADMVERGEVKLDDPVEKFLPSTVKVPSRNGKKITLLDLATHTSGLPTTPGNSPARPDDRPGYVDYSEELMYEFLSGFTLTRDIGSEYAYSNLGMGLLGFVLSRRAGKSLEDLFHERIWRPLKMNHTGSRKRLSRLYPKKMTVSYFSDGKEAPHWPISPVLAGAGDYYSSVPDMLRFLAANMGIIPSPLARAMKRAQQGYRSRGTPGGEIGLGWMIAKTATDDFLTHSGGSGAYSSFAGINRKLGRGIVILGNSYSEVIDIGVAVLADRLEMPAANEADAAGAYEASPADHATWSDFAGLYEISPGSNIMVAFLDGRLYLQLPRQPRLQLTAMGKTSFAAKEGETEVRVRFTRDDLGKTTALEIEMGAVKGTLNKIAEPATVKVDPLILDACAGLYEIAADLRLEICREKDGLYAQATMQPKVRIFPASASEFFSMLDDMRIFFIKGEGNKISELVFQHLGQKKSGKRVQEKNAAAIDPTIYDDYVGEYRVTPKFTLTVTRENDRLFAQGSYQPTFELIPEGKDAFFIKTVDARVRFKRDKDNKVTQIVVSTSGGDEIGTRTQDK